MRIDGNIKYKSRNLFFQVRNIRFKPENHLKIQLLLLKINILA
jgi:hypothetical protein